MDRRSVAASASMNMPDKSALPVPLHDGSGSAITFGIPPREQQEMAEHICHAVADAASSVREMMN
jgi:hypothetical protein